MPPRADAFALVLFLLAGTTGSSSASRHASGTCAMQAPAPVAAPVQALVEQQRAARFCWIVSHHQGHRFTSVPCGPCGEAKAKRARSVCVLMLSQAVRCVCECRVCVAPGQTLRCSASQTLAFPHEWREAEESRLGRSSLVGGSVLFIFIFLCFDISYT